MSGKVIVMEPRDHAWKTSWQKKGSCTRGTVVKSVADALCLRKGQPAWGYVMNEIERNRLWICFPADGSEIDGRSKDVDEFRDAKTIAGSGKKRRRGV